MNASTITIGGDMDIDGESGDLLDWVGTATWTLNVTGTATASYVNVAYSDASSGTAINARDGTSTNGGNNINWDFGFRYWVAATELTWNDANNWSYGSGGAGGAGIPGASDTAILDGGGIGNCKLTGANINVGKINKIAPIANAKPPRTAVAKINTVASFSLAATQLATLFRIGRTFSTIADNTGIRIWPIVIAKSVNWFFATAN